jgi:pimeloyl-ACP methyl ester carboxylesterase
MPAKVRAMFSDKIGKVQLDFQGLMGQTYRLSDLDLGHCPILVLAGQHSPLSSRTIAAKLRDELPNVEYREFDGGHMAPIAQAAAVAAVFEEYLQQRS